MRPLLLPGAATGVSLLTVWCLSGATPRGQPWTPAVTLPQGCDGLSARWMAVLWTFRELSLCRHARRELLRNALLDLTPIIPATACHQRNDVETYSRYTFPAQCILLCRAYHLAEELCIASLFASPSHAQRRAAPLPPCAPGLPLRPSPNCSQLRAVPCSLRRRSQVRAREPAASSPTGKIAARKSVAPALAKARSWRVTSTSLPITVTSVGPYAASIASRRR
jgi:hypothetical protein